MYSNLVLPRQWARLTCFCRHSTSIESQRVPQVSKSADGISPPPRITRSSTDILQALASTIGPDPTAAHYKYHDDPYLIPLSNYRKRAYALSAEAGRKAATWVRDEHAELFTTRVWDPPGKLKTPFFNADPHIDAFAPKPIYNDESQVTEEDLEYTIKNALLEDSIKVFQLLGGTDKVNESLKMSFLVLLCFYNEKEPDSMEWLEERWFAANTRERQAATWRLGGLADKIFASMEPKTPEAYCAIIQGMAKYYQAERAHELANQAIENGIQLSTSVYNSLLGCVGFLKEGSALRANALLALLTQMEEQGLSPNSETLSSCLRSVSAWGGGRTLQNLALQIIAEFKQLGIQPGLSAYYYVMCLFCKERGPRIDILSTILNDLESRPTLQADEATDTNFFITAMSVCSDHLQDINMAERLHTLLMKGDNYKLVGDAYKESIYYRHYVTVACRHAPFERTLQLLDTLIPNVYVPEPSVMEEIIKCLEAGCAGARLAGVWRLCVRAGHARRARLVERLLAAMRSCYQYQEDDVKAELRSTAMDILVFDRQSEENDTTRNMRSPTNQKLPASAVCDIVSLCCESEERGGAEWRSAAEGVERLRGQQAAGAPDPGALLRAADAAAAHGEHALAASMITYLAECGFEEAVAGSESVLGQMLNRPVEEVRELLRRPGDALAALHPAALTLVHAYNMAQSGSAVREADSSTSSESDSDSSGDD